MIDAYTYSALSIGRYLRQSDFDALNAVYPELIRNTDARILFTYLMSVRRSSSNPAIPLSAVFWERYRTGKMHLEQATGNHPVYRAVAALQQSVPGLEIHLSGYHPASHVARDVISLTLPPPLTAIIYRDTRNETLKRGFIDLATLEAIPWRDVPGIYGTIRASLDELIEGYSGWAWQPDWIRWLNGQHLTRLTVHDDGIDTVEALLKTLHDDERSRATMMVHRHIDYPAQLYLPCLNSARLRGVGPSLMCMPSELRRAMYPSAVDIDLKACQARVLATIVRSPELDATLAQDGTPFTRMLQECDWPHPYRQIVKDAFYATCYGSAPQNICKHANLMGVCQTRQEESALRTELAKQIAATPLMHDIFRARKHVLSEISRGRILVDGYGVQHMLPRDSETTVGAHAVLARWAQAQEQWLMQPVRNVVMESQSTSRPISVISYAHDGLFMRMRNADSLHAVVAKMNARVVAHAASAGIVMSVEQE